MIRAHRQDAVLTVGIEGSATMMESPAVHALADEGLAFGVQSLRIDLRDCTVMDSTFSGTLLSLKRRLDAVGGSLTLVSPSGHVLELLRQMGLDDFYTIEVAEPISGPWTEVRVAEPRAEALEHLILDAHEQLARMPGPAARGFRAVVEELRRDQRHNGKERPMHQSTTTGTRRPKRNRSAHFS